MGLLCHGKKVTKWWFCISMFSTRRQCCNVNNKPNNDALISISFQLSKHKNIGYTQNMSTDQPTRKDVLRRSRVPEQMLHTVTAAIWVSWLGVSCGSAVGISVFYWLTDHQLLITCRSISVLLAADHRPLISCRSTSILLADWSSVVDQL